MNSSIELYNEIVDYLIDIKMSIKEQTEVLRSGFESLNKALAERKSENPMAALLAITAKMKAIKEARKKEEENKLEKGESGG